MYTETTINKQSNWIEIQGHMINFDNVLGYYIYKLNKQILTITSIKEEYNFLYDTDQEAQAEYNRIKTILGVKC